MKARNNNGTIEYQINGDWLSEGNIAIELQENARLRAEVERLEADVERYRNDSQELRREAAKRYRQ